MVFKHSISSSIKSVLCISLGVAMSFMAGWLFACDSIWLSICCFILALLVINLLLADTSRLAKRLRFVLDAASNGDFSYRFNDKFITKEEKEINKSLNELVGCLEKLTTDIRQNELFLSRIINLVDIGIVVADTKGNVVHANEAALMLLDLPVLTFADIISEYSERLAIKETKTNLHSKPYTIYTITDIRRPIQIAEVESWEKLIRVLTHEIMNSLTPINSIASSLSSDVSANDIKSAMEVISTSAKSLMAFVSNFRKFTLLPTPESKVVYIKPLIERALSLVSEFDSSKGIDMEVIITPPDALAFTDEPMLTQVLLNLLKNAVEASPSKISVKASVRTDEAIEISVANDGEAIPAQLAEQIFTPFFTTKSSGSGIGLSLSRRIITRLGGSLSLTTQPYTIFTIVL